MKPFFQLSRNETIDLTNEELNDAIRLEAIERSIKPPVTLSEALSRSEWRGYTKPAEAIKVFTLKIGYHSSNFGFLDEKLAERALEGMVCVEENSYSNPSLKITRERPEVVTKHVGVEAGSQKAAKFEEYTQDDTEFVKVRDECLEKYSEVRQQAYNAKVRAERKTEYLRLAGGNEEVAKNFWSKTEGTSWPTDEEVSNG
tara:strand:- start:27 stop:626 length:600 start_codon:yes stop_codon:yes gene_type:complete